MIADYRETTVRSQRVPKRGQGTLQLSQLIVHRDPNTLEDSGEVGRAGTGTQHGANRIYEIVARLERLAISSTDDLRRKPACPRLVGPIRQPLSERRLLGAVQKIGRGMPGAFHPHVELRTGTKAEAPLGLIQLPGRDTQIEQDDVGTKCRDRRQRRVRSERRLEIRHSTVAQSAPGNRDGIRVSIYSENLGTGFPKRRGVTSVAQRRVDRTARLTDGVEQRAEENGVVEASSHSRSPSAIGG